MSDEIGIIALSCVLVVLGALTFNCLCSSDRADVSISGRKLLKSELSPVILAFTLAVLGSIGLWPLLILLPFPSGMAIASLLRTWFTSSKVKRTSEDCWRDLTLSFFNLLVIAMGLAIPTMFIWVLI